MIKHRKKLLTNILAMTIAGLFGLESLAAAASMPVKVVPLRAASNIKKVINNPDSSSIQLKGGVKIDNKEHLVTLNLIKSDLRQVLRMLADKAGKNIIIDASVGGATSTAGTTTVTSGVDSEGEISLDLVNVTVNKAFEYIMTIKQLSYWQDGNTLIVATSEKASELGLNKTEIKPIKIKYVDAQKIADFLNSNIFNLNKPDISKSAIVTSNPSTNEIYIFGKNSDYDLAKKVIAHLDTKPQVNTFSVNYANPTTLASKICMTVFQNTTASSSASSSSSSSSGSSSAGSQLNTICSGTASGSSSGSSSSSSGSTSLSAFSSSSYMVLADPGLNQITLFGGTQEQVNLAQEIIKNFDKKEPQVYLEISIIELSEEGSKDFQNIINAETPKKVGQIIGGKARFEWNQKYNILDVPSAGSGDPRYSIYDTYGTVRDLSGALQYVMSQQKGRVLANPRIIASNNTESTIDISSDYVKSITTQSNITAGTDVTTVEIASDAGIQLSVTPRISPNGYVTFDLEPEYNSIKSGSATQTLLNRRSFKAENLRVKDGETLVIAGLVQETERNSQKKTPILSDLPVIGIFFKDQYTAKDRTELIFMITPRIIKDDDKVESI
ncbi:MAG TPA: hypothetical protein DDW90_10995 [Cyanobacteria bacterium UBA9971]|nr:hypothetical protein [Cyanobacteria bacterium UBA9971]